MPKTQKKQQDFFKKTDVEENAGSKPYIIYILVGLLLISGVFIWNLSNKVKQMEVKQVAEKGNEVVQQPGSGSPTLAAKAELKISDTDPSLGSKSAKVTAVIFTDFLCPFCAALSGESQTMTESMKSRFGNDWEPAMTGIIRDYVDSGKVRLVWKDAPYHGDQAVQVHAAARCALEQGKFWEFHNYIFSKFGENQSEYNKETLKKAGADLKLNADKYNSCIDSDKYIQAMRDAVTYAQSIGVNGTPGTFINGNLVSGAQPYSQFRTIIEEELKK